MASHGGTNLQAIMNACDEGVLNAEIKLVISNNSESKALSRARAGDIPALHFSSFTNPDFGDLARALKNEFTSRAVEYIILAGYMKILNINFCKIFAGRILNIHPSLLPKYKGLNTHQRAIDNREELHGASVHFVVPELDEGPVIIQYQCEIERHDDRHSLQKKVQQGEYIIYSKAIKWFCEKRLIFDSEEVYLDNKLLLKPSIVMKN